MDIYYKFYEIDGKIKNKKTQLYEKAKITTNAMDKLGRNETVQV